MAEAAGKKNEFVRAIIDLVILTLLIVGAALGGYWYGLHEKVVPVEWVPKGVEGAVSESAMIAASKGENPTSQSANASTQNPAPAQANTNVSTPATSQASKGKYWLTSSGTDYIGYSITVSVNGDQVDNFFGPGKIVDITSKMKKGDNTVRFEAKQMGDEYNKHAGDTSSQLSVKLVTGPKITEDFKSKDVIINYMRNANESTDYTDTKHVSVK